MVTVAAADRKITEHELGRINTMVRELPAFRGIEDSWLSHEAQNCGRVLAKPDGVTDGRRHDRRGAAARACARRPMRWRPRSRRATSTIRDDERNFLTLLAEGLHIDPLVRAALERSAHARHIADVVQAARAHHI